MFSSIFIIESRNIVQVQHLHHSINYIIYSSKCTKKSPPKVNIVKGSIRNPGLKNAATFQSPIEIDKNKKYINAPYCISTKGNIQVPGKAGISPNISNTGIHKFRSPTCIEQTLMFSKRTTGILFSKE